MSCGMIKKHELTFDVIHSKGPDPYKKKWRNFKYFATPVPPQTWPKGEAAIVYFYFWLKKSVQQPSRFSPNDLFYLGERAWLSNFKNGWTIGATERIDSRYPWLNHCQNRRVFAVAYELPSAGKYNCKGADKLLGVRNDKRRSLECFLAMDLIARHGATTKILDFTGGYSFRVSWLRASDLIRDAKVILKDLSSSYGV
jgi:hypothetical protein